MRSFSVAEKFVSINGEGVKAGELAVFLRFAGCNLNCGYCDTKWANSPSASCERNTVAGLCEYVRSTGVKNVTLTGGEPLLQKGLDELIVALSRIGCATEIETNGALPIWELALMTPRPSFTMDYKLPGSGMEEHMLLENFAYLDRRDTVKFVVGDMTDLERAKEIIKGHSLTDRCHVYLSPVFARIEADSIVTFMKAHSLNGVRLQLQLHKYIWEPDRRGV